MKRLNPKTGKPFKHGDTREDGKVFKSYNAKRMLPHNSQYFYENWRTLEEFNVLLVKQAAREKIRKELSVTDGKQGRRRINVATGGEYKYGDVSEDGTKVFNGYLNNYILKNGYVREVWYTLEAFEKRKKTAQKFQENNFFVISCSRARSRAKDKNVSFNITPTHLEEIFPSDNRCPVFGTKFEVGGEGDDRNNSPSLDRIQPEIGYIEGNVVWVSNRANILKRDATWQELQRVAEWLRSLTP